METYVIMRRRGWTSRAQVEEATARSTVVLEEDLPSEIKWIRSYVFEDGDGTFGAACVYQATGIEAIREHATKASVPANEILKVTNTLVVRPDPEPAAV